SPVFRLSASCSSSPIALFFLFFFYSSADHRDLHSFPTRRSSDLKGCRPADFRSQATWRSRKFEVKKMRCCAHWRSRDGLQRRLRSEEHTSELQSRFDLVCRLLLEKKKTNTKKEAVVLHKKKYRV